MTVKKWFLKYLNSNPMLIELLLRLEFSCNEVKIISDDKESLCQFQQDILIEWGIQFLYYPLNGRYMLVADFTEFNNILDRTVPIGIL